MDINKLSEKECRELLYVIRNRIVAYNIAIDEAIEKDVDNLRGIINQALFDLNKTVKLDFEVFCGE